MYTAYLPVMQGTFMLSQMEVYTVHCIPTVHMHCTVDYNIILIQIGYTVHRYAFPLKTGIHRGEVIQCYGYIKLLRICRGLRMND